MIQKPEMLSLLSKFCRSAQGALLLTIVMLLATSFAYAQSPHPTVTPPPQTIPWIALGGSANLAYSLAAVNHSTSNGDSPDVYATWSDGSVQINSFVYSCVLVPRHGLRCTPNWTGWTNLGGLAISSPTAVAWGTHQEAFVIGGDNMLWHRWADNGNWSSWRSLGGPSVGFCSDPSAVSWGPLTDIQMDVFVQGCDSQLWHLSFHQGWKSWEIPTGTSTIAGNPKAIALRSTGPVVVVAPDLGLEVRSLRCLQSTCDNTVNAWGPWEDTGLHGCSSDPSVAPAVSGGNAVPAAFVACPGNLMGNQRTSGWGAVESLGIDAGVPSGALLGSSTIVFYLNRNNVVCSRWFAGSWNANTRRLSYDEFTLDPIPLAGKKGISLFEVKSDGSIWTITQSNPPCNF